MEVPFQEKLKYFDAVALRVMGVVASLTVVGMLSILVFVGWRYAIQPSQPSQSAPLFPGCYTFMQPGSHEIEVWAKRRAQSEDVRLGVAANLEDAAKIAAANDCKLGQVQ